MGEGEGKEYGFLRMMGIRMRITVHAKPNAKVERVEQIGEREFAVAVHEPPREGRANGAITRALAAHFGVATSCVRLVAGYAARQKIFEIAV